MPQETSHCTGVVLFRIYDDEGIHGGTKPHREE
jgi:hypothetical protein